MEGTGGTGGPGCGARGRQGLAEAGGADTTASQISHVIYRGHFSRCPKNVAIPTTQMQCLNNSSRNYVRNYWLSAIAGHQGNAPSNIRHEGPTGVKGAGGPGCGAHGRWRGLAGQRGDTPSHTPAHRVPLAWRAQEGAGGTYRGADGRRRGLAGLRDDAPSEAHCADVSRAGRRPPAHTAAGHNGARPLVGTQNRPTPQRPGGSDNQREGLNAGSRRCRDHRDHFPDGRSKCQAWMRCPWRCLPCVGLRRKRWKSGWSTHQRSRRWFRRSRPGSGSEPAVRRTPGCQCH